ncbi:dihydrolipoamide acetyltransferase family protein [Dethiosulfatarculus sandiegensis]|uniref:Dihydrolipoamide acetyltransferase component of pyruvate dehydrogenase complex n=1 Tax=Dethiosulfatarculus sandiegensis TaxID=1429043 RepID=A0A0D2J5Z0_9BACT|nr:dihydrolipoamide acetyltransferase family protein [Dethiosulfatarculus sandiegensis]KIX11126.1 catalytic domain-containing protein [Dethiosulfatarculus sandiegensis]
MSVEVTMPKWGLTMEEGIVSKWFKQPGDAVEKGEPLFEVETEKITNQVESPASGILHQIVVAEGSKVPVGTVLAVLAEPGETPAKVEAGAAAPAETGEPAPAPAAQKPAAKPKSDFKPCSPAARRLAKELGVDISLVEGTGPNGRITEKDVQKFHEQGPPEPKATPLAKQIAQDNGVDLNLVSGTGENGKITKEDVERFMAGGSAPGAAGSAAPSVPEKIPFSGMRKAVAENMMASLKNAAQLTAFVEIDVTRMAAMRDQIREEFKRDESVKVSYNDILICIVARALKRHPIMNSTLVGEEILLHPDVHMGIAVALPEGLIVPVLKDADKKGLLQIAREARELATKARKGRLEVDQVTGGTFTISNTSMYKVDGFTPILRPPETGILGVGRVKDRLAMKNGEVTERKYMTISLTYDHQVVDGAPAHAFLETVALYLENPSLALL